LSLLSLSSRCSNVGANGTGPPAAGNGLATLKHLKSRSISSERENDQKSDGENISAADIFTLISWP